MNGQVNEQMAEIINERANTSIRIRNGYNLVKTAHKPCRNPENLVQKNVGRQHREKAGEHALSKTAAEGPNKSPCAQGRFGPNARIWMKRRGEDNHINSCYQTAQAHEGAAGPSKRTRVHKWPATCLHLTPTPCKGLVRGKTEATQRLFRESLTG